MDYMKIDNFIVYKDDYFKDYEGKYEISETTAAGMCLLFSRWLRINDLSRDNADNVYSNASCVRGGNRLDLYEQYNLTYDRNYIIDFLFALKDGTVCAEVYDVLEDSYVCHIVIKAHGSQSV